jgi:hypothetical protein
MQCSVSLFCVSASSVPPTYDEIVDVARSFSMGVDQVVSQAQPIHRRRPRGVVRMMQVNVTHKGLSGV